jgi:electron transfer flavoprotein alpha subunit
MSNILVILQYNKSDNTIAKASRSAITVANQLKDVWNSNEIYGVFLGKDSNIVAGNSVNYGLNKIFYDSSSELDYGDPATVVATVFELCEKNNCNIVVVVATSFGKDIAGGIAQLLDAGQASDILAVNKDGTLVRPMFAGDVIATVQIESSNKVVTVRGSAFDPFNVVQDTKSTITKIDSVSVEHSVKFLSENLSKNSRPELADAEIVVSGGRALQSSENFAKVLFPLADQLGAAIGASRAAVDAGYAPNDWQVGQTGKIVSPKLYIAVGISGAIQHLAGMKDSKVIVAINKDSDAPIFEIADYGLVADLYQAVPELINAIKEIK